MKKTFFAILSITAILLGITACGDAHSTIETGPSSDVVTDAAWGETNNDKHYTIHSIKDLNTDSQRDSHADSYLYSSLEQSYRETDVLKSYDLMQTQNPMYPRVKKISDNEYFMLLMNGQYGGNIVFLKSTDGVNFKTPRILFSDESILGGTDTRRYVNADAAVLDNGDILIVASYRAVMGYNRLLNENGIVAIRSSDGGKTWSEKKTIYVGSNWEPYVLQLASGEIQIYFSTIAEKVYLHGFNDELISSGIGIIRSTDGGNSWTPNVTGATYAPQYVMKQYTKTRSDGVKCFTDQMPSAIELHNGTIALVGESCFPTGTSSETYYISLGYSSDNWSTPLGIDETGPQVRRNNIFLGAGPYLDQFESGETLLTYNLGVTFSARLGSTDAKNFGDIASVFTEDKGFWGSCLVDSSHSAILTCHASTGDNLSSINVGRFYLNHDVKAGSFTPGVDGGNEEWSDTTDAFFIGSDCQAQVSLRFSADDDYVYILGERLDEKLVSADGLSIMLDDGTGKGFYNLKVDLGGVDAFEQFDGEKRKKIDASSISVSVWCDGTVDNADDKDKGAIYEIKIPKEFATIKDGKLLVNIILNNKDAASAKIKSDAMGTCESNDKSTWKRVLVEG